ncbi:vesicle transport protein SEC20 isoform X1 [Octopus sinensis]|uniref:Vesicle transport protein SEC20 isoform X1 n=1 Tax=Octopus sinensis TaxID=2607531 RepID=A0A6P7T1A4_9MOLL|nr:vesicle transport protein SEC20 isoform X1 [Octopus sinensis]
MEAEDVHVKICLQEIVKLDLEVQALIQDIREYENTSLSKITGDGDFNSKNPTLLSLEELNLLANDKLTKLRSKIKELERLAQEQEMENNQNMIMKQVQTHQQALLSSVNSLRKAKLTAQMTLDRRLREEFFSVESPIKQRKVSNHQALSRTANSITDNLISLNRMMATQVKQSEQTINTLASSSKTVDETHEEFKGMSGHIHTSKKLLSKYNRREFTDRLLIILALVFFFATVLYIVKKRLWSK